ncbi:hypothetical protein G9272_21960 [Streptomyces asoensis]|uniref:DUF3899 domain-containing protein n=1 Tax=Streptomyces asoensis TaxID=249586 RepID=A0A6M4WPX5_9ACTN|nr:hypothetical protein [Streptomyces asoensis]QJT02637.1 hypothetical protein G9272_21960 [Streptomyces asoensis]
MLMIATTAAASSDPTGVLVLLAVLGAAAVYIGARWAFDLRGAVDATLARRRAALELKGQRTGNLGLADTESLSPGFYRLIGGVMAVGGLALLTLSLILAIN